MGKGRWHFRCKNVQLSAHCSVLWFSCLVGSHSALVFRTFNSCSAKLLQSCPTLCDPTDGSPPGSPIPGILQARTLEWVAISFSNAWKWKVKVKSLSHVWLFTTRWTVAHQVPLSMGFSRQEYWSGVPLPSPNSCSGVTITNSYLSSRYQYLYAYIYLWSLNSPERYVLGSVAYDWGNRGPRVKCLNKCTQ